MPALISVAMVVRNMERFLGEAVESILNQTFRDFEFVIVDFGSSDRSLAIITQYQTKDSRIKLQSIEPCSLPQARTASLQCSRGRYIALMDADDIACPDRLERQVAYLEAHPEIALLGSAIECMDEAGVRQFGRQFPLSDNDIRAALQHGTALQQTTVMMRREVLHAVQGYRKALSLAEDYDLWLRVIEHFQVANLAEPLVRYRIHPGQVSVRRLRQEVTCWVAARAAAEMRARDGDDPLWDAEEITPDILAQLGVTEAVLTESLIAGYCDWMNAMLQASDQESALRIIGEMMSLPRDGSAGKAMLANACLAAAHIHYQRGAYLPAVGAALKAMQIRPTIATRPLTRLLRPANTFCSESL